jgi:hypothetical protein
LAHFVTALVPGFRARLAGWLTTSSDLILLHLCFLVACLPVVTIVPAAIALQRSTDDVLVGQETVIVGTFYEHFRWAVRRFTVVSLLVLGYALLVAASLYLWSGFDGVVQAVGMSFALAFAALCTGLYLAGLAWTGSTTPRVGAGPLREESPAGQDWRWLWHGARKRFADQPAPVLACVLIVFGWLLLFAWAPPLGLFGFGLVPALLAHWLNKVHTGQGL